MTTTEASTSRLSGDLDRLRSVLRAEGEAIPADALVDLGPARLDPARSGPATGAFLVDTGARRVGDGPLVPLHLASTVDGSRRVAVIDVVAWQDDRLLVEAELTADELTRLARDGHRFHLVAAARPGLGLRALHDRLAAADGVDDDVGLGLGAELLELVMGRLRREQAGLVTEGGGPAVPPQLGVILGSPDRRRALMARAIEQLVAAGRSVLVVSPDPVALDAVVLAADRMLGGRPVGTILRVGLPSTLRIGGDPRITPNGLAARAVPGLLQRLHELASELRYLLCGALSDDGLQQRRASAAPPVEPTDPAGPTGSAPTSGDDERGNDDLDDARRALEAAEAALAEATARAAWASARHAAARQTLRQLDQARQLHRRVDELVGQVERVAGDLVASATGVARLAAVEERRRQLLVAAEVATVRLDRRDLALAELAEAQAGAARLPHRRADVAAADRAVATARAAHAATERALLQARAERARTARRLGELTVPATADPDVAARVAVLRQEYRRVRRQVADHRPGAPCAARVVATTVDRLVADPAVHGRRYDNVLVEQAGCVPAAYLLWAAGLAGQALTLSTSLDEHPPPPAVAGGAVPPELHRWLTDNVLELLGLGSLDAVRRHPGGLVLD